MAERRLAVVLHDVAPATWPDYAPFVDAIDALAVDLGPIPLTWLVVPDFHHQGLCSADPAFIERMNARLARGDELALHGYHHCDDSPPPRTPYELLMRRVYTREGEFQALDEAQAGQRLDRGAALFDRQSWPVPGFVAPAWLMGSGARRALVQRSFVYTSDRRRLYSLPDLLPLEAPGLVWSARSAWRRGASRVVCALQHHQARNADLLRLGIHPVDMRHPWVRDYWLNTIAALIQEGRRPITKRAWVASQTPGAHAP
ncbi:polysaccharide deacetylase family protein [Halomonas sp. HP20-15]|uniref:polysaccharide deacetylase family protein n=1 Tax=Halomonas sp. HP20-15 TaxID=3085901 RepID=UPI002982B345|nr:polysaccharide deacetylase family protein [Halomonas sp. HP20-15]MDW5376421.1 polysaccharide deacetylase family protein [Halomonas sp. HP20-15]